jgi:hypothetical protein
VRLASSRLLSASSGLLPSACPDGLLSNFNVQKPADEGQMNWWPWDSRIYCFHIRATLDELNSAFYIKPRYCVLLQFGYSGCSDTESLRMRITAIFSSIVFVLRRYGKSGFAPSRR